MEQEFSSPDVIGEGGVSLSPEAIKEASEKYQERAKQTQARLQQVKKDESHAQKDSEHLFLILSKFIQDEYYEALIPTVTELLRVAFPSRAIIAYIGLFYPDAAYYMAKSTGNQEKFEILRTLYRHETLISFDEEHIHTSIREWVTVWIGLVDQFLSQKEKISVIMTQKTYEFIEKDHMGIILESLATFFVFFFRTRNLDMPMETGRAYARFIQRNILNALGRTLALYQSHHDHSESLLQEDFFTTHHLF